MINSLKTCLIKDVGKFITLRIILTEFVTFLNLLRYTPFFLFLYITSTLKLLKVDFKYYIEELK